MDLTLALQPESNAVFRLIPRISAPLLREQKIFVPKGGFDVPELQRRVSYPSVKRIYTRKHTLNLTMEPVSETMRGCEFLIG